MTHRPTVLDPKPFLKTVARLRRLGAKRDELRRQLNRARISEQRRGGLEHKRALLTQKIGEVLKSLNLSSSRLEDITQSLKRSADRVSALEQRLAEIPKAKRAELVDQVRAIEEKIGISADQIKDSARRLHENETLLSKTKKEFIEANLRLVPGGAGVPKLGQQQLGDRRDYRRAALRQFRSGEIAP